MVVVGAGGGGLAAFTPGAPNCPHSLLQPLEARVKGSGNVSLWRSERGGVKGEAPPPTLCQNVRYTLPSTHRRFPPLIWRARRITGATSPLGAILFPSGLRTQLCQAALPELGAPPPRHSSQASCAGPKQAGHGNVLLTLLSSALRGASILCRSHARTKNKQPSQCGHGGDGVLPWRGQCQNQWL